jgi:hypothetical protein
MEDFDTKIHLKTGRIKNINGNIAAINIQGTIINVNLPQKNTVLKKNQKVSVGVFDGQSRIIG